MALSLGQVQEVPASDIFPVAASWSYAAFMPRIFSLSYFSFPIYTDLFSYAKHIASTFSQEKCQLLHSEKHPGRS